MPKDRHLLSRMESNIVESTKEVSLCRTHQKQFTEYFCNGEECQIQLCPTCIVEDHSDHRNQLINVLKKKDLILEKLCKTKESVSKAKEFAYEQMKELDDAKYKINLAAESELCEINEAIIELVERIKKELLELENQTLQIKDTQTTRITEEYEKSLKQYENLSDIEEKLADLMSEKNDEMYLKNFTEVWGKEIDTNVKIDIATYKVPSFDKRDTPLVKMLGEIVEHERVIIHAGNMSTSSKVDNGMDAGNKTTSNSTSSKKMLTIFFVVTVVAFAHFLAKIYNQVQIDETPPRIWIHHILSNDIDTYYVIKGHRYADKVVYIDILSTDGVKRNNYSLNNFQNDLFHMYDALCMHADGADFLIIHIHDWRRDSNEKLLSILYLIKADSGEVIDKYHCPDKKIFLPHVIDETSCIVSKVFSDSLILWVNGISINFSGRDFRYASMVLKIKDKRFVQIQNVLLWPNSQIGVVYKSVILVGDDHCTIIIMHPPGPEPCSDLVAFDCTTKAKLWSVSVGEYEGKRIFQGHFASDPGGTISYFLIQETKEFSS